MAFGQIKKLKVDRTTTRECVLEELILKAGADPVVLIGGPATEQNEKYFNALMRSQSLKRAAKQQSITVKALNASRQEDVELFSTHVLTGWKNVFDEIGVATPFTPAACSDLLGSILADAPDMFTTIRSFFGDISNFRESMASVEELAKNS